MRKQTEPDGMWNSRGQYKEELERVHAPAELTAFVKERAAAEEKRWKQKRNYRRIYLPAAAAAACAVTVFGLSLWRRTPEETKSGIIMQPYLGSTADTAEGADETVQQQTAVLPVEFLREDAWTEELYGAQVKFVHNGSVYMAAFAGEAGYTVVSRKTEDLEAFRESIGLLLQDGGKNEDRK